MQVDPALRRPGPADRLVAEPDVFAERLGGVTCPSLQPVGEDSFALAPSLRSAANLPHLRLARMPDAGHGIPLDNPQGFLSAVEPLFAANVTNLWLHRTISTIGDSAVR